MLNMFIAAEGGRGELGEGREHVRKGSVRWYYERAVAYYALERTGKATIELYKAVELDSSDAEVNFLLGSLLYGRGQWAEAVKYLEKVDVGNPIATVQLAESYVMLGDYRKALSRLEQLFKIMPLDEGLKQRLEVARLDLVAERSTEVLAEMLLEFISEVARVYELSEPVLEFLKGRGKLDPILVISYALEEDGSSKYIKEELHIRGGFGPVLLALLAREELARGHRQEALQYLEAAVRQLEHLGLSEAAGDFSTEEIRKLRGEGRR